jgi:diaminopimelate epimerase
MQVKFSKYQGAGNDFIIIDNRIESFPKELLLIKKLCDRHFGIGADGLMLLESHDTADFYMRYFNSDGNESTMCGNGGRCITYFAQKTGIIESSAHFLGIDGEHMSLIEENGLVNLKMQDVDTVEVGNGYYFINTGSPHYVSFVDDVNLIDVNLSGNTIRNSFNLKNGGTNVNFVDFSSDKIHVRTYERGVESETLACGTGSVATAIALNFKLHEVKTEYKIITLGGELTIKFDKIGNNVYKNIWLRGPATHVFDGIISI